MNAMRLKRAARAAAGAVAITALADPTAAFQLTGRVVDPDGAPVVDVDLDLENLETGSTLVTPNDNTDSHGRFALEVPSGFYRVLFEPPAGLPLAPHVVPRLQIAGNITLDIRLPRGIGLAGRITGPDGLGVADVDLDVFDRALRVKLPTPGGTDRTNALGFYSLLVPPGTYDMQADPPLAAMLASSRVDSLVIDQEDVIINVQLQSGWLLSGTVRAPGGRPVAGIDLDATDLESGANVPLGNDKTDAEGRYALVLRGGRYKVEIQPPPATRLVSVVEEITCDANRTLDLTLSSGFLVEGRVRDPSWQPVEAANLDFKDVVSGQVMPTPSDFTNLRGDYAVVLPQGSYDVIAFPPRGASYPPDTTRAIEIASDRRLDLNFGPDPSPPAAPVLLPAFPNPTPGGARIPFQIPEGSSLARITIVDAAGRTVKVLTAKVGGIYEGGSGLPGEGLASWDGRDRRGFIAPSGVYFVRLEMSGQVATRKLVVFRESLR